MSFSKTTIVLAMAGGMFVGTGQVLAQFGVPITDPAPLNTNAAGDGSFFDNGAQIATDRSGIWVTVWISSNDLGGTIGTDDDILIARSTDNGVTWSAPAPLNTNAATDSGSFFSPQITTDGAGNWLAVWVSNNDLGETIGTDYDILVARSTDNGATWSAPAPLNTNAATDSGRDIEPQIATDDSGNWVVVWESGDDLGGTIGADGDILLARSTDNGATWSAPVPLNTNAATDTRKDSFSQIAMDGSSNVVVVWASVDDLGGTIGTDYDILVARSADRGVTWTSPMAIDANAATDDCTDVYPEIGTDGSGNWLVAWSSDMLDGIGSDWDIFVARSTDNGANWTAPTPLDTHAATDSDLDEFPQIAADGAGNWVSVWFSIDVLANESPGFDWDIFVARSTDNGVTWTAPATLNINAATDSGNDTFPQIATDGSGNWVVVWESRDDLSGTIGIDSDILLARFMLAVPSLIPTVSEWGLVVLALLTVTAGTIVLARRRSAAIRR